MTQSAIDPVCAIHGKRWSEHEGGRCLYCCLCFRPLTIEQCHVLPDGSREDVCNECAEQERNYMRGVTPETIQNLIEFEREMTKSQKMFGPYPALVVDWWDGDTCHLTIDLGFGIFLGAPISCRVWGINAPELRTPEGKAAREAAIEICPPGVEVSVMSHSWDKYGGRFDGSIELPNGLDFAAQMVGAGFAAEYFPT